MRILFVNKFLYPNGGSETYIFELGKQLVKMSHEVQYFGMEHPDRIVGNNAEAYTTNMDFHGKGESNSGRLSKLISKASMPFRIIYSKEARTQIRRVLEDFAPDVVHLNNINFQITPSIIYEIRAWEKQTKHNCRIVFTAHDYQWICPNHMMYIPQSGQVCDRCKGGRYIECTKYNCIHGSKARSIIGSVEAYYYKWRKTYSMVDTIICPSQFLFDRFAEDSLLRDKLVMMHNFIVDKKDLSDSADNDSLNQFIDSLPSRYVLYFGRYDIQKGIKTLIDVCRQLPNIQFVFAGKGPLEEEINPVPNIKNVGFRTGNELRELISRAEFSVYPSEWYENCPFSIMESQMLGTPVVGANSGGIPELINTSGQPTGMVFEPGNVEELSKAVMKLWNDRDSISQLSNNAKNLAFDSLEGYSDILLEKVYRQDRICYN